MMPLRRSRRGDRRIVSRRARPDARTGAVSSLRNLRTSPAWSASARNTDECAPMLRSFSLIRERSHDVNRSVSRAACIAPYCLWLLATVAGPLHAADPAKTLRVEMQIAETSFDPAFASDAASDSIIANIFDAMLDYDYLARPVKLVPRVLEALPSVEDGGRTY